MSFTSQVKETLVPIGKEAGQIQYGQSGEKKILVPTGIGTPTPKSYS
jgi:hypothetical protein